MRKKIKYLIRRYNDMPLLLQHALLTAFLMTLAGARICVEHLLFGAMLLVTSLMCASCIVFAEMYRRKMCALYYEEGKWKGRYNILHVINKERIKLEKEREKAMRDIANRHKAGEQPLLGYYTNKEFIRAMKRRGKKIIKSYEKRNKQKRY